MRLVVMLCTGLFLFTLQTFSQDTTDGIVWYPPIQLTDTSYSAYEPKIALSGDDTIHVTWKEDFYKHRLPYARCINGVWEPIKDLITDTVIYPYPFGSNLIIAQDQNVYMFSANEPTSQTTSPRETRMHKSTNGGTSWSSPFIAGDDSSGWVLSANVNKDTLILVYAPEKSGYTQRPMMIVSTDDGDTWILRSDTLDGWTRTALTQGALHLVHDVFVNGAQEKLYLHSTDLGVTWEKAETLSTVDGDWSYEHAIAAFNSKSDSSQIIVAWRDGIACAGMVGCTIISRESYTNGNQWTSQAILNEEPNGYDPAAAISENGIVALAWTSELLYLNDHVVTRIRKHPDSTWSSIVDHTPSARAGGLQQVAVTNKAIYLVWSQSVGEGDNEKFCIFYRRGVFLTTDVKEHNKILPNEFSLSQNYPNPFNPCTKIRFTIQESRFTTLKVYDVFGREATTLVNEIRQPGEYTITWDAGSFASGVYFYRLTVHDSRFNVWTETRKAILMK